MNVSQHRYYRGGLLYSICDFLGIEDKERASRKIHEAIKECFEISSFSNLSSAEFEKIAGTIRMIFCREFGYIIREPDEEAFDPNELTMKEFLEKKNLV